MSIAACSRCRKTCRHGAIDKAADVADSKTGGKYSDKIDKAADAAKKAVPPKE
ncbi:MAG: antitoxin [Rhodococcus sp. (in: high G+C Gram-positive bacteria)]|nr:MAG: antitoxin [Rhodococcus sp. (in: high G+C Gram-positive bacteria)]